MSLRDEELSEYLLLVEQCASLAAKCSDLYQAACLSRGKESVGLSKEFDDKLGDYLKLNARRDLLWLKLMREDSQGAIASVAAAHLGRLGRAVNSEAQQEAARENGKKGGRR